MDDGDDQQPSDHDDDDANRESWDCVVGVGDVLVFRRPKARRDMKC